jgi:hypothetical protein
MYSQVFHQILSFSFLQKKKKNSENFNVSENNINSAGELA